MSAPPPTAPLNALDALALDCEATGLDARAARIIEIGAVWLSAGRIGPAAALDQRIDPGMPIPPASTAVHGITDQHVAGQPRFADVVPTLAGLLGDRLLIGHSIAYDLALLAREHKLAGAAWSPPRALDVRTLARAVAPGLADHGLDRLCDWLGVTNARRHSALGDAQATAEVFLRLVPLLRQKGIRTLAEAEQACTRLAELDARTSGGLMAIEEVGKPTGGTPSMLDVFAYRHRVRDVMTAPATIVEGTMPIRAATALMLDRGFSSVFVDLGQGITGIATERDVLRAVHALGAVGLDAPVGTIAKHPLQTVEESDHVYRAIGRMERLGFRHLGVRDGAGNVVGALTPRNLLRNRATAAIAIGDATAAAGSAEDLAVAWAATPDMAASLLKEAVEARTVAGVVSSEICAMTQRAALLAEARMAADGHGGPPAAYAVLVLGSAGRGESLLAADQDNAIIFEAGEAGGAADRWFERMAVMMTETLDEAGIVLCKGGVMARNAQWRLSQQGWEAQIEAWVRRQRPQDLLNVDIFFDAVAVHGDTAIGDGLLHRARDLARRAPDFLKMLTELARQWHAPLKLFGGFQTENGRVDLKKGGLMPIFTGSRVLALRHGIAARSTAERLRALVPLGIAGAERVEHILDAHETLMRTILLQQLEDGRKGVALSPRVDPARLGKTEQRELKAAIETVRDLIDLVSDGRL